MTALVSSLAMLGIISVLMASIFTIISWQVHKSMTQDSCSSWDFGSYNDFKREFLAIQYGAGWDDCRYFKRSYFCRKQDSEIHASIIKFRGVGMVLGPIANLRAMLLLKKYSRVSDRRHVGAWSPKLRAVK